MISGISGQMTAWPDKFIQMIMEDFYVIVFDNRDVGLSSYYDHLTSLSTMDVITKLKQGEVPDAPYTLHDMAEDTVVLMDNFNIQSAHICGVSMGGQIAQVLALDYPEKVLSLALLITSPGDYDLPPPEQKVMDYFFNASSVHINVESAVQKHLEQYKIYNHPDDYALDEVEKLYYEAYKRSYHPEGVQRQLIAMLVAKPRGKALEALQVPTVIIQGGCDPVFSIEHGERLHQSIKGSKLFIIPNMGHGLPARVFALISKYMSHLICIE